MIANALLLLKRNGYIERAIDASYLGQQNADHVFELDNGRIVSVDLVIESVVINKTY